MNTGLNEVPPGTTAVLWELRADVSEAGDGSITQSEGKSGQASWRSFGLSWASWLCQET